ncbi:hypothetical protein NL676_009856 [Syzygium grande]|nr:hypothetical protein NL676_009856 [Syzygium grande]
MQFDLAGQDVTDALMEKLTRRGYPHDSIKPVIVRGIKEKFAYMAPDYGKEIEKLLDTVRQLRKATSCVSNAPESYSSRGCMGCMQPGFTRPSIIPSRSAMTRSGKTCTGASCSVVDLRCFREWPTARVRRSLLLLRAAQRSTGEDVTCFPQQSPAGNQHFSFD